MIPKVIHYCWFGGSPLPEMAKECMASWKKFFGDYEIKEWNESNFDINCCDYVKEAYQAKKWAFVSDYARFWILYNYGGLYFDTDVEVIRSFDDILAQGAFMGCEPQAGLAPGLGLGANPGMGLYKEILDFYHTIHFILEDGSVNEQTVVKYTTDIVSRYGFREKSSIQKIAGINIYPPEYFCPKNYETGLLKITNKTVSIHHYTATWHSRLDNIVYKIEKCRKGKQSIEYKCRRIISFAPRVINKIKKVGLKNTCRLIKSKIEKLHSGRSTAPAE